MPEVNNIKRKRSSYVVNPDGNCTPSDSESDDDEYDRSVQRKIPRRLSSNDDENAPIESIDGENSNISDSSSDILGSQGNSQLLYAALQKIRELENELAELDEAEYDSGHHDEDDIDEGNASDFGDNIQLHDHRDEIREGDAEALGFAFCVKETFEYLAAQGLSADNPIVSSLREQFLDKCD